MLKKLRIKFVCTNMLIVTVMLCIIFGLVLNTTKTNLQQQNVQMMETIARDTSPSSRPGMGKPENVPLPYFKLYVDHKGRLIRTESNFYDVSGEEFLSELISITIRSENKVETLSEYSLRFYRQETPFGQSIVFSDISGEVETVNGLIRNCVIIGAVSFAAFLGISMLLARWAVRPVDKAWQQQKQFTADASHELKTPLTVIMTNAELMQTGEYTETEKRDFLSNILTMSHQMRGLVEQLLEMARLDNGAGEAQLEDVELSELVLDAEMPFEPVFFEKGLTLTCRVQEGICVNGSRSHLTELIEIYLDNAGKYSYPGTEVQLCLTADRSCCTVSVQSIGDTISQADLKNIFKRFYRVDKGRSRSKGGTGLGLAIVKHAVLFHGGTISVTNRQTGGLRFEFTLKKKII